MRLSKAFFVSTAVAIAATAGTASASDVTVAVRPVAAPESRWGGFYTSFSAGGTWTRADFTQAGVSPFTNTNTNTFSTTCFVPPATLIACTQTSTSVDTGTSSFGQSSTGSDKGAVFTFTAGYNFVWNRWLVGVQSEVSYNLTRLFLQGSSSFTSSNTQISQTFLSTGQVVVPPTTTNSSTIQTQAISHELRHNWTVSEMGKIGFLATPDLLAYGLLGWSWGGFDVDNFLPYTLDGFTYGGGFERDFGWLRGFIQVKAIDYRGKSLITGNGFNSTSTSASAGGAPGSNFNTNNSGGTTNSTLSTHVTSVTAGITIPLIFPR